jgi:hypothetical protein
MAKADGTEPKKLSKDSSEREIMSPAWSPDSQYAFVSKHVGAGAHEVWMYHVQGGSGVQVTRSQPAPNTPPAQRPNVMGVTASRDGRWLYYARSFGGRQYNRENLGHWQIVRRDRNTGDEDTLTAEPGSAVRPALSPDGTKLTYATRFDGKTGLRVRDLRTGKARWLKYPVAQFDDQESDSTRDLYPNYAFMPDGREIVIAYDGKIHRLNIEDGTDQRRPSLPMASDWRSLHSRAYMSKTCPTGRYGKCSAAMDAAFSPPGHPMASGWPTSRGIPRPATFGRCVAMVPALRNN